MQCKGGYVGEVTGECTEEGWQINTTCAGPGSGGTDEGTSSVSQMNQPTASTGEAPVTQAFYDPSSKKDNTMMLVMIITILAVICICVVIGAVASWMVFRTRRVESPSISGSPKGNKSMNPLEMEDILTPPTPSPGIAQQLKHTPA